VRIGFEIESATIARMRIGAKVCASRCLHVDVVGDDMRWRALFLDV
jgi:hypothetical protein